MELITIPRVRTQDAFELFGGKSQSVADALGCTRQAVEKWGEFIPEDRARLVYELFPEEFEKRGTKAA